MGKPLEYFCNFCNKGKEIYPKYMLTKNADQKSMLTKNALDVYFLSLEIIGIFIFHHVYFKSLKNFEMIIDNRIFLKLFIFFQDVQLVVKSKKVFIMYKIEYLQNLIFRKLILSISKIKFIFIF